MSCGGSVVILFVISVKTGRVDIIMLQPPASACVCFGALLGGWRTAIGLKLRTPATFCAGGSNIPIRWYLKDN